MKKTKKLLALVLAMLMVFSLMAVTAAAYDAEEHEHTHVCSEEAIQPRKPAAQCLYCGFGMVDSGSDLVNGTRYITFKCYNDECPYFVSNQKRATLTIPW